MSQAAGCQAQAWRTSEAMPVLWGETFQGRGPWKAGVGYRLPEGEGASLSICRCERGFRHYPAGSSGAGQWGGDVRRIGDRRMRPALPRAAALRVAAPLAGREKRRATRSWSCATRCCPRG